MTIYNTANAEEKAELDKAMAEAPAKIKRFKTFETKGEPVLKTVTGSQSLVQIVIKVTGASRNYSQTSQNYLKGECEGNGNAATDTFKKIWKDSHASLSTDEASQWIGRAAYDAILKAAGVDIENAPATVKTNSECDLNDLVRLDAKRAEFEEQLKAHASAILSRYLRCVTTQQVMSTIGHKLEWQDLESFSAPADQKRKLRYEKAILGQYKALSTIKATAEAILKNSGDPAEIKAKIEEIETDIPWTEGQVKANEEAEAKAARAAAREDKKAERDKETQANILQMANEFKMPAGTIANILHLSENKVSEILETAAAAD